MLLDGGQMEKFSSVAPYYVVIGTKDSPVSHWKYWNCMFVCSDIDWSEDFILMSYIEISKDKVLIKIGPIFFEQMELATISPKKWN